MTAPARKKWQIKVLSADTLLQRMDVIIVPFRPKQLLIPPRKKLWSAQYEMDDGGYGNGGFAKGELSDQGDFLQHSD